MTQYDLQPPIRTGLIDFLKKTTGGQFVIPVFQRNYTWRAKKEVQQYLNDLTNILEQKYDSHFLGIIIYLTKIIDGFGTSEFSVIDGQQRLTTTFLILYAIRDLLFETNNIEDMIKLEDYILTNKSSSEKYRYKLKPLVADDDVYRKIILKDFDDIKDSDSLILECYNHVKTYFKSLLSKYTINQIMLSLDKLYIVGVPISRSDNAQKIFESINSTGAKLTASDLIRNFILMDLSSDDQDKYYVEYWKKIETNVSSDSKRLESFFRFFLSTKNYSLTNTSNIYRDFKVWFTDKLDSGFSVEKIVDEILKYSKMYHKIYHKSINESSIIYKNALSEFRKNLSDMPAPLLLELFYMNEYPDDDFYCSDDVLSEILTIINTYLLRRAICGLDTSDITRLFPLILRDLKTDIANGAKDLVDHFKRSLVNKNRGKSAMMPDDDYLTNYLLTSNAYNNRLTIRIFFEKLENHGNSAPVEQSKLSIEHLLPQTPTEGWLKEVKIANFKDYEKYLNKIGNLTLASKKDNSKMQNNIFAYKQQILSSTGHLNINKEILAEETWTAEHIDKRTESLIKMFIELYPYVSASQSIIKKHEIFLDFNGVIASGYLYEEDGSVEVLSGSTLRKNPDSTAYQDVEEMYLDLIEDNIIVENDYSSTFVKDYIFTTKRTTETALSYTASLLLRTGSRNGWEYWKDIDGKSLNENKKLKERIGKTK